jgi:hypothetical protein
MLSEESKPVKDDACQEDERRRDAIDAEREGDAEARQPVVLLDETKTGGSEAYRPKTATASTKA